MEKSKEAALAEYEVMQAREIGGVHREVGSRLNLTAAQAKYYLPPCGTGLRPVTGPAEAKPKTARKQPAGGAGAGGG